MRVEETRDSVSLDGRTISIEWGHLYILLNKPAGYLVTASDPQNRPTVYDLIRDVYRRVFPVGRLDVDTEGVLLLTDDGDLAHRLMHPRHGVIKGYRALVGGEVEDKDLNRLSRGVSLEDGPARAKMALLERKENDQSLLYLELITGKKRQVKRMCAAIGHPVLKLWRVSFAGLTTGDLTVGQWRPLTPQEVAGLLGSAHSKSPSSAQNRETQR
jgi:23S rRNA pseudouridine2605 synthase